MSDLAARRQVNRGYSDGFTRALEVVLTPLLLGEEDQTRKIAVQLPVSGRPAWEPEHGRRIHSRLFAILAALLLGLVLLGGLGWALSLYL